MSQVELWKWRFGRRPRYVLVSSIVDTDTEFRLTIHKPRISCTWPKWLDECSTCEWTSIQFPVSQEKAPDWMSDGGVCKTAPATPGLLKSWWSRHMLWCFLLSSLYRVARRAPTSNRLQMSGPAVPVPFTESSLWLFGHEGGAGAYYSSLYHHPYYSIVRDQQSTLLQSVWLPEYITPEYLITRVFYSRADFSLISFV